MAGTRKKPQPNGKHVAWFMDMTGKQKFFTGTKSKADTLRMAERLEDEHRQIRLGYRPVPASAAKHAARPVREVTGEYLSWGRAQGGIGGRPWSVVHARQKEARLNWWIDRLGLKTLTDVDGAILPKADIALRELMEMGRAGKTLQNYREALGAFCAWAVQRGYIEDNPLKNSSGFDITPRRRRRALMVSEIDRLLKAAPGGRRLLYETAIVTGLRAGELRALKVLHLDTVRKGLALEADFTKNRQPGFQPLPVSLLQRLTAHCEGKAADVLLFHVPSHPARELREDLLAAGIPLTTPEGKIDFHSLRNTFATLVFEAGATVKEGMSLVRHASPNLTLNTYARTRADRLAGVVEKIAETLNPAPKYAVCRSKQAVGAEGLDVSGIPAGTSHTLNKWRRGESNPRPVRHPFAA